MNSPRAIWAVFGACVLVLLAGLTWLTASALRLEVSERGARQQADLEETVRLALWRMESLVAPLIARESARPYFHFNSFYPIERAYTNMFVEADYSDLLVPSPLLQPAEGEVLLYFQFDAEGRLSSPQLPAENVRALAHRAGLGEAELAAAEKRLEALGRAIERDELALRLPAVNEEAPRLVMRLNELEPPLPQAPQQKGQRADSYQQFRGQSELDARQRAVSNVQQQVLDTHWLSQGPPQSQLESPMRPLWHGDLLLLARRVRVDGREFLQGCWLDWSALRGRLQRELVDLLPDARLEPLTEAADGKTLRRLAALPVQLEPGWPATVRLADASPVRLALLAAWGSMLLAVGAVAFVLHQALALGERRAAFVSAVTHELRTPLTTFRLYTDLLAAPQTDTEKRAGYLATLRREALRLSHLVENVLAYARLERGRHPARVQNLSLEALVEPILPRLAERAAQAEMRIELALDGTDRNALVRADPPAVEQILLNLVDNACKYARPATNEGEGASSVERVVRLSTGSGRGGERLRGPGDGNGPDGVGGADGGGRFAELLIVDNGPGISADDVARLFRPFHKSARDAAHSAPGVGLGLALSRKLARAMGGDLLLRARGAGRLPGERGACFVLRLPRVNSNGGV